MRRNVEINGLGPEEVSPETEAPQDKGKTRPRRGKVVVNEGDAWYASHSLSGNLLTHLEHQCIDV